MSWVVGELIPGAWLASAYWGHGITGAELMAQEPGTHGYGWLRALVDAGDEAKEFRGVILTTPSAGTFTPNENGTGTLSAPDGAYSFTYQPYVDGVQLGGARTVQIYVGVQQVAADFSASYSVAGPVASDLATAYAVLGSVSADLVASSAVLSSAAADLVGSWSVASSVGASLVATYLVGEITATASPGYSARLKIRPDDYTARMGTR